MKNTIRIERAIVNITQEGLCKKVNVSRQTINAIEAGRYAFTELALKVASVFGGGHIFVGGIRLEVICGLAGIFFSA